MANLAEQAIYEPAVYELATTDPLLGGAGGQLNIAAQQLANRTAFLNAAINALQTALQNAGTGNVTAADITAAINAHLAAADPHPQYTTVAEVTALIASNAPAAPVSSVAGKTGAVTLTPADASAEPANANIQAHIASPHQPLLTADDAQSTAMLSFADADTLIKTGFYNGFGKNWAILTNWQYMIVIRHSNLLKEYVFQEAFDFFTDKSFRRRSVDGVWSPWVRSGSDMIGMVIARASTALPAGYLECNGTAVSRTVYAALFAACGIAFGTGNGTTTFNIPDLRGEFVRGWDHMRGVDAGRVLGSWQADMFKSHTHSVDASVFSGIAGASKISNFSTPNTTGTTTSTGGAETRPRNVAMMYCIKY